MSQPTSCRSSSCSMSSICGFTLLPQGTVSWICLNVALERFVYSTSSWRTAISSAPSIL
uniref:Uncharacterized protein n=1 Tax=Anopheles coluzzii TaxID=1518534 RepID=A0A6E8W509_ANOCL